MSGFSLAASTIAIALLQSLEDNFTLAVSMFIVGFIATVTTVIFVVVMHLSTRDQDVSGKDEDQA